MLTFIGQHGPDMIQFISKIILVSVLPHLSPSCLPHNPLMGALCSSVRGGVLGLE